MIEDLEAELNGAPKNTPTTDDVALNKVENDDEAITEEATVINDIENDLK